MKGQIEGQMNIFDFIKPRAENMPMKDYLTMQGFKNEYYEVPDHECIVEVADIHEYPKLHIYKARYHTNKFGYICQIYPKNCGYSCPWWREIIPEMPMGLDFFKDGWHLMEEGFDGIGKDTPLEVLGKYKMNGKEHWSQCPAYYDDKNIHPMEVPWDIPRPKFIYWRIKPQKICNFSGHSCNKKELWEIADSLDELQCPHVCCRQCNTRNCGARCNGSTEPEKVYPLDIRGICDDPYCPQCGYPFETIKTCKNYEVDCERCPECHVKVDWTPWHRLNDEETRKK